MRRGLLLLPLLLLLLLLPSSCAQYPHVSPATLGWLRSNGTAVVDQYGRQVLFRGINARVSGLFDVTFPGTGLAPLETIPMFSQDDAQQMAADGFNLLRLPVNWSNVEPTEGQFNQADLTQLAQVIGWCRDAGIYVLVDFHEDEYSKYTGEDGAPLWAIDPPPSPITGGPLSDRPSVSSPEVTEPFVSFFTDAEQLQERFLPAFTTVVSQFVSEPAVAGYEPMNEPAAFWVGADAEADLQGFYEKVETAFRGVDHKHTLWLEPDSERNISLTAPIRATPFPDSNLVYEPHMYPQADLLDVPDGTTTEWTAALAQSFDLILTEAKAYGAAPVVGEWGSDPADTSSFPYIDAIDQLLEARNLGEAFWLWKEESQGDWGFFDHDADGSWTLRAAGLKEVARPYPLAVPGSLVSYTFATSTSTLSAKFQAKGGEAAPLLFLPSSWYPNGVRVTLNGKAVSVGTGRVLLPWSGQSGTFTVQASPR